MRYKKLLWVIAIVIIILLAVRVVYQRVSSYGDEKTWYRANLDYQCSLKVDSVQYFNNDSKRNGFLLCSLQEGVLDFNREDSLNSILTTHRKLRFLRLEGRTVKVFRAHADQYLPGDSLYIHSEENYFEFFRKSRSLGRRVLDQSIMAVYF